MLFIGLAAVAGAITWVVVNKKPAAARQAAVTAGKKREKKTYRFDDQVETPVSEPNPEMAVAEPEKTEVVETSVSESTPAETAKTGVSAKSAPAPTAERWKSDEDKEYWAKIREEARKKEHPLKAGDDSGEKPVSSHIKPASRISDDDIFARTHSPREKLGVKPAGEEKKEEVGKEGRKAAAGEPEIVAIDSKKSKKDAAGKLGVTAGAGKKNKRLRYAVPIEPPWLESSQSAPAGQNLTSQEAALQKKQHEELVLSIKAEQSPDLVLWHTYDGNREDVLDWSGNGSIGEFMLSDKIPTRRGWSMRTYGDLRESFHFNPTDYPFGKDDRLPPEAFGYRIMPSEKLDLSEGTVTFWLCVAPDWAPRKNGIILSAAEKGEKTALEITRPRRGKYTIQSTFGARRFEADKKLEVGEFYHVAWNFSPKGQAIYINGKKAGEFDVPASLPCGMNSGGLYVGYAYEPKKDRRLNPFAGILDDLRIYNKVITDFPDLYLSPLDPKSPPFGLVLHLDFDEGTITNGDKVTMKNKTILRPEIIVEDIVNENGTSCPKIPGDKASFNFKEETGAVSMVWIKGDLMDLPSGTLEITFRVNKKNTSGDPRWILASSCNSDKWENTTCSVGTYCWSWDHEEQRNRFDKNEWKTGTYFQPCIGHSPGSSKRRRRFMFKMGEWVKLVVMWGGPDKYVRMWANDVRLKTLGTGFRIYKEGGLRIGRSREADGAMGFQGEITDIKLWNYYMAAYPNEVPSETGLPDFYLKDKK